jgi:hypothetical protein
MLPDDSRHRSAATPGGEVNLVDPVMAEPVDGDVHVVLGVTFVK